MDAYMSQIRNKMMFTNRKFPVPYQLHQKELNG